MSLREVIDKIDEMPLGNLYLGTRYSRVTVEGEENLPQDGASLVVSNHEHFEDSFLYYRLFVESLGRTPHFAVGKEFFNLSGPHGAIMREFLLSKGQIPVDRFDRASVTNLRTSMRAVLDAGEIGVIFPESTTPKTGYVHRFHTIAAQIALDAQVPITMMHISYQKPSSYALRHAAIIRVASPLQPSDYADMERSELSTLLQEGVASLGGQAISSSWASDPSGYWRDGHSNRFVSAQ